MFRGPHIARCFIVLHDVVIIGVSGIIIIRDIIRDIIKDKIFDLCNCQSVMHIVVRNGGLRTRCSGGRAGCPWCAAGVPGGLGGQVIDLGSFWGSCRGQPVVCQPVPGGGVAGGRRDHWCRPVSAPCSGRGRCAAPDRGLGAYAQCLLTLGAGGRSV